MYQEELARRQHEECENKGHDWDNVRYCKHCGDDYLDYLKKQHVKCDHCWKVSIYCEHCCETVENFELKGFYRHEY